MPAQTVAHAPPDPICELRRAFGKSTLEPGVGETGDIGPLLSFARLTRPEFLLGGIALYWMGTRAGGDIGAAEYLAGQALVTSTQLLAHYANEYFDFDADRINPNRTWFSGGSGVLVAGRLEPVVAWRAAMLAGVVAAASGVAVTFVDWRLAIVALVALAGSWWYSAPPLRLVASGFGELATSILVGGLVPLTGALAAGSPDWSLLASLAVPTTLASFGLLVGVHAPDAESDAQAGKTTLVVRLGGERSAVLHRGVALATIGSIIALAPWRPGWSTLLSLPGALLLLGAALLVIPNPRGSRALRLTVLSVAPVGTLAVGFGLGTVL